MKINNQWNSVSHAYLPEKSVNSVCRLLHDYYMTYIFMLLNIINIILIRN